MFLLLLALGVQGIFDWLGGVVLVTDDHRPNKAYFLRWLRAVVVQVTVLVAAGALTAFSIKATGHPTTAIIVIMVWLALGRDVLFCLMDGAV